MERARERGWQVTTAMWLDDAERALRFALIAAGAAKVDDATERRVPGQVRGDLKSALIELEHQVRVALSTTLAAMKVEGLVVEGGAR